MIKLFFSKINAKICNFSIAFFCFFCYHTRGFNICHHSIRVSTLASHAGNAGSNPAGGTKISPFKGFFLLYE